MHAVLACCCRVVARMQLLPAKPAWHGRGSRRTHQVHAGGLELLQGSCLALQCPINLGLHDH
jgi:hypothetical protein